MASLGVLCYTHSQCCWLTVGEGKKHLRHFAQAAEGDHDNALTWMSLRTGSVEKIWGFRGRQWGIPEEVSRPGKDTALRLRLDMALRGPWTFQVNRPHILRSYWDELSHPLTFVAPTPAVYKTQTKMERSFQLNDSETPLTNEPMKGSSLVFKC